MSLVRDMVMPPTVAGGLGSAEEILGLFGPVATAKTSSVTRYVYQHCQKYARLFPGQTIRWVFVRDTYESVKATTLKTFLEWHPAPACGTWNEARKQYTVRVPKGCRAEVLFMGLDDAKDVGKLLSLDLSGGVIEEPAGGIVEGGQIQAGIPEYVYRGLIGRLRHPTALKRRRLIVLGNPPSTAHWCHRVFRPDLEQPRGASRCVNVPAAEAPILRDDPTYYERLEEKFGQGSPDARRYVRGEWLRSLAGGFHRDMIPIVPRDLLPPLAAFGATCDPALGGKSGAGDRSAIVIAGAAGGKFYVFDIIAGRIDADALLAQIFEVQARYRLGAFGFENVGFSAWLEPMIKLEQKNRELRGAPATMFNLIKLPRDPKIKKETRIQNTLGVRLADQGLCLVEGCRNTDLLYAEMEAFPEGEHDDILDALADLDQIAPYMASTATVTRESIARAAAEKAGAPVVDAESRGMWRELGITGGQRFHGTGQGRRMRFAR